MDTVSSKCYPVFHISFSAAMLSEQKLLFSVHNFEILCWLKILFFLCIYFIFNRFCAWPNNAWLCTLYPFPLSGLLTRYLRCDHTIIQQIANRFLMSQCLVLIIIVEVFSFFFFFFLLLLFLGQCLIWNWKNVAKWMALIFLLCKRLVVLILKRKTQSVFMQSLYIDSICKMSLLHEQNVKFFRERILKLVSSLASFANSMSL